MDRQGKAGYNKLARIQAERERVAAMKRKYFKKVLPKYEKEQAKLPHSAPSRTLDEMLEEDAVVAGAGHRRVHEKDNALKDRPAEPISGAKRSRRAVESDEEHDEARPAKRPLHRRDRSASSESIDAKTTNTASIGKTPHFKHSSAPPRRDDRSSKKAYKVQKLLSKPNRFTAALKKAEALAAEKAERQAKREETAATIAAKQAERRKTHDLMKERTQKGQPVMRHRMLNLLEKVRKQQG